MDPAKTILKTSVQITIPLLPSAKIDYADYRPAFVFEAV